MIETNWLEVQTDIWPADSEAEQSLSAFLADLSLISNDLGVLDFNDEIERLRRVCLRKHLGFSKDRRAGRTAFINLMADLARQGWTFRYDGRLLIRSPESVSREARKAQLLAQRVEQLRTPSVQSFIRKMEKGHWHKGRRVSIFSLMRDGRDLASSLGRALGNGVPISSAIRPYLQFVHPDAKCEHTGLPLADVWRYFRYTWSNPYQSVPGRSMVFLVRDSAAQSHPIMGIGALSSAAVKLRGRDEYLRWDADKVLEDLLNNPSVKALRWLESLIEGRLGEIYRADLIEDGILPPGVEEPTQDVLSRLRVEASGRRAQHHSIMESREYKGGFDQGSEVDERDNQYWEAQARNPLFRSKRASELANLFLARQVFRSRSEGTPREQILALLKDSRGREAVAGLVKLAKATRVGTAIADLTICGAIPPYNPLLVGKLVALLAVSPEVIRENRRRYGNSPSIIASSMAGRAVVRPADLVFVGTTSLYGERPCQYDRISLPAELLGGEAKNSIRYKFIADTVGWGTFQFSDVTTHSIMKFVKAEKNGQRVNYVFGEGANPKMRALREGLAALGFDEDQLLRHGHKRSMYGVALVSNLSGYLLGQDSRPKYLYSLKSPEKSTQRIVDWWIQRWLTKRLNKGEVLEAVQSHTLIHPIEHGARVRLPSSDPEQFNLLP